MQDTMKYVRHRKLGENELYIYKDHMSAMYVLQETNRVEQHGHIISWSYKLESLLIEYNRAIKEYNFYNN